MRYPLEKFMTLRVSNISFTENFSFNSLCTIQLCCLMHLWTNFWMRTKKLVFVIKKFPIYPSSPSKSNFWMGNLSTHLYSKKWLIWEFKNFEVLNNTLYACAYIFFCIFLIRDCVTKLIILSLFLCELCKLWS